MAYLRARIQEKGISSRTTELLLRARSEGTTKSYESAWIQFTSWCEQQHKDPIQCDINTLLSYLTDKYEKGYKYRTLNIHRSAISLYHNKIEGFKVGQHPLITELLKAIGKLRPPKPKMNGVWDVDIMLKYLKGLPTNAEMEIKSLTLKTIMLIALVAIPRVSEIHRLDLKWMVKKDDHLIFQIEGNIKHSKQGKQNPPLIIHKFEEDHTICPVQTIVDYIERTKDWRQKPEQSKLFLTTIKPHTPVAKTTISNWIKHTLKLAGINTELFTAHSTRSSSSSKSRGKGLSRDIILNRGNWKNSSTFEKFYHKEILSEGKEYQKSVLQ